MIAGRERYKAGADRAPVVRRRGILIVALMLSVILMLAGFFALSALANEVGAQQQLYTNPELRFLNGYSFGDRDQDGQPPSCAATGGACYPIIDSTERGVV